MTLLDERKSNGRVEPGQDRAADCCKPREHRREKEQRALDHRYYQEQIALLSREVAEARYGIAERDREKAFAQASPEHKLALAIMAVQKCSQSALDERTRENFPSRARFRAGVLWTSRQFVFSLGAK